MFKLACSVVILVLGSVGIVLAIELYELIEAMTNLIDAAADYLRAKTDG